MGAFSDDETSRDSQSLSSRGSGRAREGTYAVYRTAMCGAIFTIPSTGERQYVCFNKSTCRRPEHKDLTRCTLFGYLFCLKKTKAKSLDGILESHITEADFQGRLEEGFASNRTALRSYAAQQAVAQTSPASNTPSTHSGYSALWQHVAPPSTGGPRPLSEDQKHSIDQYKSTNRVQVAFTSPVAEVTSYATGPPSASVPTNSMSLPTFTPELKPPPPQAIENLSAAQLDLARQILLQESINHEELPNTKERGHHRNAKAAKDRKKKSRKASSSRSGRNRSKGRKPSRRGKHSSPSSSSSSDHTSDSEPDSDASTSSGSSSYRPPVYWYAVAFGLDGRDLVTRDKREAKSLRIPGWIYRRFETQEEAWQFVDRYRPRAADAPTSRAPDLGALPIIPEHSRNATLPQPVATTANTPQVPGLPPMKLAGRDKSTKTEDEIFGISLDVDATKLQGLLAPPGVTPRVAQDLAECLLDSVSLPGKTGQSTESDDVVANLQVSLEEIGRISRQEQLGDQHRRDLKWNQLSRNVLKTVKNNEDLRTMLQDVFSLKDRTLSTLVAWQKTILSKEPWDSLLCEAWSGGGYHTVLSRKSLEHYLSLLEHLLELSRDYPWDMVQQEIDFYVQKWVLIRNNSQNRIMAICRIYVDLRDGAARHWITPKLEAKKLLKLYQELRVAPGPPGSGGGSASPSGSGLGCCTHCGTFLHGTYVCAWASVTGSKAKEKGRATLRALGNQGNRAIQAAMAAGNQEG